MRDFSEERVERDAGGLVNNLYAQGVSGRLEYENKFNCFNHGKLKDNHQ